MSIALADPLARAAWERALALWGVRMHDPALEPGAGDAHGTFAWFGFPPAITVDPAMLAQIGALGELESVFAHELGHHVLAPRTRLDALKIRHQLGRALAASGAEPLRTEDVDLLANLWTDLLVNARVALLQRRRDADAEPGIVALARLTYPGPGGSRLWWVYRRAFELLWNLPAGTLCALEPPEAPPVPDTVSRFAPIEKIDERFREKEEALREARLAAERVAAELARATTTRPALDARLIADAVRAFAADPVSGALRFGVLAAPYVVEEARARAAGAAARGAAFPGAGTCATDAAPATADELGRLLADPRLRAPVPAAHGAASGPAGADAGGAGGGGQGLGVAHTLALYAGSEEDAVLAAWYRAEAAPWVRPYTQRRPANPAAELPGPVELWDAGDDLAEIDWSQTLQVAPVVVPGVTTRRRSWIDDDPTPAEAGIDLDVYIDSSGSMPGPRRGSPAVLAGTVLALSVLRGGGRVRVTSFSGPGQVGGTPRYTRDSGAVVAALTLFFAGGTTFPLDLLDERYAPLAPPRADERRHLVVLSDDGLVSMFGEGNAPYADVAARARAKLTTATLVLRDHTRRVAPLAAAAGYDVSYLETMADAPAACARLAEVLHG